MGTITGPIWQEAGSLNYPSKYYRKSMSFRQTKPRILPLQYEMVKSVVGANTYFARAPADSLGNTAGHPYRAFAYNKAYSKFRDHLGESTSIGIDLAQWRQADAMIKNRASKLIRLADLLLSKAGPRAVANLLSVSPSDVKEAFKRAYRRDKYAGSRQLSNWWLELHFGWEPLVKDIYSAMEVFEDPLPTVRVQGRGTYRVPFRRTAGGYGTLIYEGLDYCQVRIGADVFVDNPNLRLLEQLGLANPLSIAFDAVPWSFVLNWFYSVEAYLGQITTLLGLTLANAYTTTKSMEIFKMTMSYWPFSNPPGTTEIYGAALAEGFSVRLNRVITWDNIEGPSIIPFRNAWKPVRGLTAVSLLTQKLPKV